MSIETAIYAAQEVACLQVRAKEAECYETPEWAAHAILEHELLTKHVWDVCCGPGVLAKAAKFKGHTVIASDLYDWGYGKRHDFLLDDHNDAWPFKGSATTIFMNPPFSKAVDFVKKAHDIGARKIVCFQRFAWWESQGRESFWNEYPPARIYVCGSRASCWLLGTPDERRKGSGTTTAHAWFIWEEGHNTHMPALGRLYNREAA